MPRLEHAHAGQKGVGLREPSLTQPPLSKVPVQASLGRGFDFDCQPMSNCPPPVGFDQRILTAMPDKTTGPRSGNSATSERLPPMALTVLRSVDSSRSLRFSSRIILSCVILSFLVLA